ncbi:DHA2 family efflux MFS transporter permease subunit [Paenibacillus sp. P46E]|uniref:DHA2 family efflux MFS transporter permease subunit n=1 Tax=Paenibacillus sp. P46E TaxID=1349436 RepID=UPI00093C2933|nr:DHA2 family efflux MFS transporter permease subunit [Paenibacillus sp. P46E]OKP97238.1 multidrug transporter [Paenibacillus sp. P46E]
MSDIQAKPQKAQIEKLDPAVLKVALILVFGALAPLFDSTMVNVAIDTLRYDLNSTVSVIQWVITGYILTMGMAVPVSGWAVNRFGGKKVYMFALVVFFAGSVLCSLAWSPGSLISFRLLQGVGAGILIPTLQTVLVQTTGGRNLGRVMSIISVPTLLGPILGPVLGGIMIHALSWRWIFYVNIPITMIALLLAWRGIPSDKPSPSKQSLDIAGLLLLSPAFATLIYSIAQISNYGGLKGSRVILPLVTGLVLMAAFIVYALRTKKAPLLDLRLFKSRIFCASNATVFLAGMVMNGALLLLPLYYQQVCGESVLYTGVLLIPQGIGMLLTRSWIGGLSDRMGSRIIVILSLLVTIAATLPFTFAGPDTNQLLLAAALLVRGAALNGLLIPVMVSAYDGLRKDQVPHASISIRIFQTIGGAFGAAILATVIAHQLSGHSAPGARTVADAFHAAFWWSIGFTVAAFIPSVFLSKAGAAKKA